MSVPTAAVADELGAEGAADLLQALGQLDLCVQRLHLELLDARVHLVDFVLEIQHALDAREVEPEVGRHLLDAAQPSTSCWEYSRVPLGERLGSIRPRAS